MTNARHQSRRNEILSRQKIKKLFVKSVAPKLQKLSHRKVPIIGGRRTTNDDERHQPGKTYSLVEMKFRRDKNIGCFENCI